MLSFLLKSVRVIGLSFMFAASDDESGVIGDPSAEALPPKLKFLSQVCLCRRRCCYQQFLAHVKDVQEKQQEFQLLQSHEKARVVVHTKCFLIAPFPAITEPDYCQVVHSCEQR